jgi:hypothetical protein
VIPGNQTDWPKSRTKIRKRQIAKDGADGIIRMDGEVSELADEHDLGSCAARRAGSSPAFPTQEGVAMATLFSLMLVRAGAR